MHGIILGTNLLEHEAGDDIMNVCVSSVRQLISFASLYDTFLRE